MTRALEIWIAFLTKGFRIEDDPGSPCQEAIGSHPNFHGSGFLGDWKSRSRASRSPEEAKKTNYSTFFEWSPSWTTVWHSFLTYHLEVYMAYLFWHSIWQNLTFFLAYTLTFYLAFRLKSILTYFVAYILTFFLAFYLASILTFYPASFQEFFLAYVLTFSLTFFLAYVPRISSDILSGILSGISSEILCGGGPAGTTAI